MSRYRLQFWVLLIASVLALVAMSFGVLVSSDLNIQLKLSWFALIPAFSIITNIYLLLTVSKNKSDIKSILWFCIFIIATIFWALGDLLLFSAANTSTAVFARTFVLMPPLIGVPAFLIFISDTTRQRTEKLTGARVMMFIAAFWFLVVGIRTELIHLHSIDTLVRVFWGWEIRLGEYALVYLLWSEFIILFCAGVVARYYFTRKRKDQKKQARIYLLSIMIPIIGSTCFNIVPAMINKVVLPLDSLFTTIMAALMVYGINRYQLFLINPAQIANNILETMTESVVVTDLNFELQYANENASQILNLPTSLENHEEYLEDFFSAEDFSKLQEVTTKGVKIKNNSKIADMQVIAKKTGKYTPVEISISEVRTERKKSVGYVFVISDISALQKAYAELAKEEEKVEKKVIERTEQLYEEHAKLEVSVAGLPLGFIMLDENMGVLERNEAAKTLFKMRGKSRWYAKEALEEMGLSESFAQMDKNKKTVNIPEIKIGRQILNVILSPILTDKNKKIGSVIIINDITNQKAAEIERNEFIVTASHEIRTPLSVIQGNLSNTLDMAGKVNPTIKPLITTAYNASNQLSGLFTDILIVSDIENQAHPKPKYETTFELGEAISEVAGYMDRKVAEKKLKLKFEHSEKFNIKADRDEIKECISKLVDNAIKFTQKGLVEIKLTKSGNKCLVDVIDSGKGISESEEKRLFKKFVRLDNSLKREVGGAGLGLYIAKALAERNEGELRLKKSTKRGSVFQLELPIVK